VTRRTDEPAVRWGGVQAVGIPARGVTPVPLLASEAAPRTMAAMEVIAPQRPTARRPLLALIGRAVPATLFIVCGLSVAYLAIATPFMTQVLPSGRLDPSHVVLGMTLWTAALVAPAAFLLMGATRLARILAAIRDRGPRRIGALRALDTLPDGVVVATGLTLADGRPVSDVVLGPFGAAVIRELPPTSLTRVQGTRWEARTTRGWISIESPLDRSMRDAERVRRWLSYDHDFVVKTYAAVVGPDPSVARTSSCAVLRPDELGPWLASLPPQRTLTERRRDRIMAMAREAAGLPEA
jgi:hypothetical protein